MQSSGEFTSLKRATHRLRWKSVVADTTTIRGSTSGGEAGRVSGREARGKPMHLLHRRDGRDFAQALVECRDIPELMCDSDDPEE
jgi:hypothetical protein